MILHFLSLVVNVWKSARLEADTTLARAKGFSWHLNLLPPRTEELVSEALAAFKIYSGDSDAGAMTNFPFALVRVSD